MIKNKYFEQQIGEETIINLYHLDIYKNKAYFKKEFGDVKIVCMGGKASRMEELAKIWRQYFNSKNNFEKALVDYSGAGDRFSMYKVNQIIFLNHGMGVPSLSIALNEVTKLLHFAGVTDPLFIRIGTCGGLGLQPGMIVVTEKCYDGKFDEFHEMFVCGKSVKRPAILDESLRNEFIACAQDHFKDQTNQKIIKSNTMCTNDFYEEQARMDGAFNQISTNEKNSFLKTLIEDYGVRNIEMESLGFAAFCHNLEIKGMVVCIVLLNRIITDLVQISVEEIHHNDRMLNELLMKFFRSKIN